MLNYMKSELYRIFHTGELYLTAGVLVALVVLLNVGISVFGGRYHSTSFSYSNLVAYPMAFVVMGAVIAFIFYEGGRRNGNLKNTVASGISRSEIFAGQCLVSLLGASLMMFFTMAAWVASAELLIEENGPVELKDFLLEAPALYLIAAAAMISGILFLELFEKNITAILVWSFVWFLLPKVLLYLSMRFTVLLNAASWLPCNFFGVNALHVNTRECITFWDTTEGWIRCIFSGAIGIVIFTCAGSLLLRKRDL